MNKAANRYTVEGVCYWDFLTGEPPRGEKSDPSVGCFVLPSVYLVFNNTLFSPRSSLPVDY